MIKKTICVVGILGALTACQRSGGPAPVVMLGQNIDSPAGAIMVHRNDTLWNIATRHRLPLRDIIDINRLEPPYLLNPGQRIKLPAPRNYNVQFSDTLYGISRVFGVDTHSLVQLNGLREPYTLTVNQQLRIPSHGGKNRPGIRYGTDMPGQVMEPIAKPSTHKAYAQKKKAYTKKSSSKYAANSRAKRGQFAWPVNGRVLSSYGPKKNGVHNDGINIAAPRGAAVHTASKGTVVYVGDDLKSFGNLILIRHENGWMTAYAHLDQVKVKKGQTLSVRQVIGTVGTTGTVTTPQVHFEVRKGGDALNPSKYLSKKA